MDMGVGRGDRGAKASPFIFKISAKKGCFRSLEREKTNLTTFWATQNIFRKLPKEPPSWKILVAPMVVH